MLIIVIVNITGGGKPATNSNSIVGHCHYQVYGYEFTIFPATLLVEYSTVRIYDVPIDKMRYGG